MINKQGLSIVIITYNRRNELKQTLRELLAKEYDFLWEIVVVDQNSTDGTHTLFELQNKNLKYIKLDKNMGVSGGRNVAARYASFEYMLFIDDDSSLADDTSLSDIYHFVDDNRRYSMFALQIRNLEDGLYNWPYGDKKKVDEIFECKFFIGCGHVICKSFFEKVGGYTDELFFWGEETELILKSVSSDDFPVLYNGKLKIIHRVHGDGRNGDANRFYYQVRNRFFMIKEFYPYFLEWVFGLYYFFGYFVKAVKYGWIREFVEGLRGYYKMKSICKVRKLKVKQIMEYIFL